MDSAPKTIILLGHGSRVPDAGRHMEKVVAGLKAGYGYKMVEYCYMSRLGPHFPEVFKKCVNAGAKNIMVIPYFLHDGLHLVLDIPEMLQRVASHYPDVRLVLGKNLGFDSTLVDLVERRIVDSSGCPDIREVSLPPRNKYPVPKGQCEFVPMLPEEAAKFMHNEHDHDHHGH